MVHRPVPWNRIETMGSSQLALIKLGLPFHRFPRRNPCTPARSHVSPSLTSGWPRCVRDSCSDQRDACTLEERPAAASMGLGNHRATKDSGMGEPWYANPMERTTPGTGTPLLRNCTRRGSVPVIRIHVCIEWNIR